MESVFTVAGFGFNGNVQKHWSVIYQTEKLG